jgi:ribosomal protein S18 acetylase RimI-like enzyme
LPYGTGLANLHSATDLAAACADDSLCMWAAQGPLDHGRAGGTRAWAAGHGACGRAAAVAVASPDLSLRNRVAVWGEPDPAADLMAQVLPVLGPSYRPLGDSGLITELCARLPGLAVSEPFGWMYSAPSQPRPSPTRGPNPVDVTSPGQEPGRCVAEGQKTPPGEPRWLAAEEMATVAALLGRSFPDSYAWPARPGVRRWAGIDGPDGELAAVAADAWSAPTVGFMAGVAVREDQRGSGLGSRVCRFLAGHLIAGHGRVALMVDSWNDPAIRLYRRLGLTLQQVRAAWADPG